MKKISPWVMAVGVIVAATAADFILGSAKDVSLLGALLFWTALGQGVIALLAAADMAKARWIEPVREYMYAYYPLLLIFPALFLVFSRHISVYNWSQHPSGWLSPTPFIVRNAVVMLLPLLAAHFYAAASRKKSPRTGFFALIYLLCFVLSQSFMAYDLVMTLEYPWINTLMGPFFFVEALYAGMAFCVILSGFLARRNTKTFTPAYADFTLMIIGFALFWAGLFYSQYLVIWYGNIPEEVSYISKRLDIPITRYLGVYILLALFLAPFLSLISRKLKSSVFFLRGLALVIFSGLIAERMIYLIPATEFNYLGMAVQLIIMGIPYVLILRRQVQES